ncbi:hypothetical protein [Tardiphaga robiniae]|uniref:Uncharacterized protein n=1 Tax=Tardiphaga robiniae TaxID=943830 RepID=A0A7G6TVM9_9BRAD|nr:hypothetical protein [Tardiphaga robiniae]QND70811.1 hypothetical protein HB776_05860 [Tardiphaga robiniae]
MTNRLRVTSSFCPVSQQPFVKALASLLLHKISSERLTRLAGCARNCIAPFLLGGVLQEPAFLLQEHRAPAASDTYFCTSLVRQLNAAQDSFATERNHVNYSNILEIIRDKQEQQCGTVSSGSNFISSVKEGPALDAALARLDAEFKTYSARFKGGR